MLGGTEDNVVKAENLLVALGGVMNLQVAEVLPPLSSHRDHKRVGPLCFDQSGFVHFYNRESVEKLHQKFVVLSTNRNNKSCGKKKPVEHSFRPKLNKKSESLYQENLGASLISANKTHSEYLYEKGMEHM